MYKCRALKKCIVNLKNYKALKVYNLSEALLNSLNKLSVEEIKEGETYTNLISFNLDIYRKTIKESVYQCEIINNFTQKNRFFILSVTFPFEKYILSTLVRILPFIILYNY